MENIYRERIERLRGLMRARNWDAVLVTGGDPHGSEYPAERWKQVQWLSGFTGEAGDIVVTLDHAGLWTDTRYFIQARRQLEGTGVELHKTRVPGQVLIPEWLEKQFGDEGIIALDGLCAGVDFARSLPGTVVSVPDMLSLLWQRYPQALRDRYKVDPAEDAQGYALLEAVGRKRGFLVSGGEVDTERAARVVLEEYRSGKLGRFTLDVPPEEEQP